MPRKRVGNEGMTLVELLVVLAIIGIMAAIGIPSMMQMVPRIRLNSSAMVLSNEIALARMRAISKSTSFGITFNPVANSYTIFRYQGGTPTSIGTTIMRGTDLLSVVGFTPTATSLMVDSTGKMNIALNTLAWITLQTPNGQVQKRITVEPNGRMYVERSMGGGNWVRD